ncbi:PREDICTED: OTU domain-containing protein 3 isoform X1 [Ficedula albicollis]|nr:PREDICTED: OTU domain-containing protein 3 isoform X1 [Ficedula albicollis]
MMCPLTNTLPIWPSLVLLLAMMLSWPLQGTIKLMWLFISSTLHCGRCGARTGAMPGSCTSPTGTGSTTTASGAAATTRKRRPAFARRMSDFFGLHACVICWDLLQMLCKKESNKVEEVKPQKGDSEDETEVEEEDAVQKVCNATGCSDTDLVSHVLEVEDYNVESAIFAILQMKEGEGIGTEEQQEPPGREQKSCSRTLWEENGTGSRIFGNQSLHQGEAENAKGRAGSREENRGSRNSKVAKKQRKKQQWLEKKRQQEERHRQKVLASKRDSADTRTDTDPAKQVTLVKAMAALNI